MNNKTSDMNQYAQTKVPDWLRQDVQEEDFLLGKVPQDLQDTWEDEE